MNIAIALLIVDWLLFNYVFKYQRVTLELSRLQLGQSSSKYQMLLTPNWVGVLGWLMNLLHIVTAVAFFVIYGWLYAAGYLLLSFIGYSLIDFIIPYPTKRYFLRLIKNYLSKEDKRQKNTDHKEFLDNALKFIKDYEKSHL